MLCSALVRLVHAAKQLALRRSLVHSVPVWFAQRHSQRPAPVPAQMWPYGGKGRAQSRLQMWRDIIIQLVHAV